MAVDNICGKLKDGLDTSCEPLMRKYYQQAVVINKNDIDDYTVNIDNGENGCEYNVEFSLKEGAKGFRFMGAENGNVFLGRYSKSVNEDNGHVEYIPETQFFIGGVSEKVKCILDTLDKGRYVVAMQAVNGTVEIYGIRNGLTTDEYDYSPAENGGGASIVLKSNEDAPESELPLVYKSENEIGRAHV